MKKIIYAASSVSLLTLTLTGCGTWNNNNPAHYVNTGVGYVTTPVVSTVGGVRVWTGYPATRQDVVVFKKKGIVYKNGHTYTITEGKYVLVR